MTAIPHVRVLLAPNPSPMTLDGTRTYLIGQERPVVIDPGPADESHLRHTLDALGGVRPVAILLTHGHPDHSAGAVRLASRTGAPIMMAHGTLDPSLDADQVACWIANGDEIATEVGIVRAVATPGHAPEHLAFLWRGADAPAGGALFVGDLFMGEGDTTLIAPPEGDVAGYLHSLDTVLELQPGVLLPAHGPPLPDPRATVERYRAHREARIEQVCNVLREIGSATAAQLVRTIYGPELHPGLVNAAEGSIHAMLRYLQTMGRVASDRPGQYAVTE
jgi:glyoxylase-like metal-dependent hydrolase (beta-lactamase superfamily II)